MDLKITILGSGTSGGVPSLGCQCEVCRSTNPKDKRLRSSAIIESDTTRILIDSDPDDDFSTMTGEIEPWQWPSFAPELPHGFIYNIIYGHKYKGSNQRIFVLRGIANGFETELTFKKTNGEWKLTKLVQ